MANYAEDFISLLHRCKEGLAEGGIIFVKVVGCRVPGCLTGWKGLRTNILLCPLETPLHRFQIAMSMHPSPESTCLAIAVAETANSRTKLLILAFNPMLCALWWRCCCACLVPGHRRMCARRASWWTMMTAASHAATPTTWNCSREQVSCTAYKQPASEGHFLSFPVSWSMCCHH